MDREAISLLASEHIIPILEIGTFICGKANTCEKQVAFKRSSFLQHLRRNGHNVEAKRGKILWNAAVKVGRCFPLSHPLRQSYVQGGADKGPLPFVPGLIQLEGIKCPECNNLYAAESTLRRHLIYFRRISWPRFREKCEIALEMRGHLITWP